MNSPCFSFYADDFLAGVADMTQSEVGAYILLLCQQWNRGSIPVQPERQQLLAKGSVSEHVLSKFKVCEDGSLKNDRLEKVRINKQEYIDKQRLKGIASGIARSKMVKPEFNRGSTAVQPSMEPETNIPIPIPIPIINPPTPKEGVVKTKLVEELPFESVIPAERIRIGKIFNKRKGKDFNADEMNAWKKITPVDDAELKVIERFYGYPENPSFPLYRKTSLLRLLRHWDSEVDKANRYRHNPNNII